MNFSDFGTQKKHHANTPQMVVGRRSFPIGKVTFSGLCYTFQIIISHQTRFPWSFRGFPESSATSLGQKKTSWFQGVRNSHLLSTWGLPLLVPTAITLVISDEDRHHSQGQEKEKVHSQLLEFTCPYRWWEKRIRRTCTGWYYLVNI